MGSSTGATIKPHPVYDTVKGAAVGTNLPVRAAAVPAYRGVGVLQRSRQIQRPAQDAHQLRRLGRQHPRYRRLPTIRAPHPLPRLCLSARSGGQAQKPLQSRTPGNQNRALKARKQRFLTTVHSQPSGICSAAQYQCLYRAEVGNRSEAPHRNRAEVAASGTEAWSRSRRVARYFHDWICASYFPG